MLKKPSKIEQEYIFTHTELERILWMFGTHIAATAENRIHKRVGIDKGPITTCHTDAWVVPAVKKEMDNIRGYYGE